MALVAGGRRAVRGARSARRSMLRGRRWLRDGVRSQLLAGGTHHAHEGRIAGAWLPAFFNDKRGASGAP
jgi:hypothetical protein